MSWRPATKKKKNHGRTANSRRYLFFRILNKGTQCKTKKHCRQFVPEQNRKFLGKQYFFYNKYSTVILENMQLHIIQASRKGE